jgi:hypothetical protein
MIFNRPPQGNQNQGQDPNQNNPLNNLFAGFLGPPRPGNQPHIFNMGQMGAAGGGFNIENIF